MRTTKAKILTCMVLLIGVMLITGIAWAEATKTAVAGIKEVTPSGLPPVREWWEDGIIWHVRGLVANSVYSGELVGAGVHVVNINLDYSTGNGDESGYATLELTWGELSGTFEGRFSVTYTGWVGVGHGVYHGTGDFAGMKLMENFTIDFTATPVPPFIVNFEGIILDPHGE